MNTIDYLKSITTYAGYDFGPQTISKLVKVYEPGLSVGDLMIRADLPLNRYPSNLLTLKDGEAIYLDENLDYKMYIEILYNFQDLSLLRAINISENSINLTNQALEHLCSGRNVEELKISEERHFLTTLPIAYLTKLKILFICNDRNVIIDDDALKFLPNLITLALSWNNLITNTGLKSLKHLIGAALYNNDRVNYDVLSITNPKLQFVVSSTVDFEAIPNNLTKCFHSTTKY